MTDVMHADLTFGVPRAGTVLDSPGIRQTMLDMMCAELSTSEPYTATVGAHDMPGACRGGPELQNEWLVDIKIASSSRLHCRVG